MVFRSDQIAPPPLVQYSAVRKPPQGCRLPKATSCGRCVTLDVDSGGHVEEEALDVGGCADLAIASIREGRLPPRTDVEAISHCSVGTSSRAQCLHRTAL